MTSAERWTTAVAVAIALAARLLFVLVPATPPETKVVQAVADGPEYVRLADNLARHRVFSRDTAPPYRPELFRTPGYPLLLAPLHAAFGGSRLWATIGLQLLLSVALVLLSRRLALEQGAGRYAAAATALFVAASPNLAFLATKAVTETLFTVLLVTCLLLLGRFRSRYRPVDLLGASLCAGLLVLVRPIATFLPLVVTGLAGWWWLRGRRFRPAVLLLPLAGAAVVVSPWLVRNGHATGRYIVSTAGEHNLYLYNAATVLAAERGTDLAAARDAMRRQAEADYGRFDSTDEATFWPPLARVATRHLLRRPDLAAAFQVGGLVACCVSPISLNPLMVHAGIPGGGEQRVFQRALARLARGRPAEAFNLVRRNRLCRFSPCAWTVLGAAALFLFVLMVLAILGAAGRNGRGIRWLLVPTLYFMLLAGPVGEARFRAPVEPVLALFAGAGLALVFGRRRDSRPAGSG